MTVWDEKTGNEMFMPDWLRTTLLTQQQKHQEELKSKVDEWYEIGYREGILSREVDMNILREVHKEEIEKAVEKELEEILNCLPLRSDWDDDVKVTFKMGIDVVREILIERIQALTPTKTDKQTEV